MRWDEKMMAWEQEQIVDPAHSFDGGPQIESGRYELRRRLRENTNASPVLSGGDIDARWDMAESAGDETAGGSMTTPDQNVVEEFGEAVGLTYQMTEELRFGDKEYERDRHRWELDPASAEDYLERTREVAQRPGRRVSRLLRWVAGAHLIGKTAVLDRDE